MHFAISARWIDSPTSAVLLLWVQQERERERKVQKWYGGFYLRRITIWGSISLAEHTLLIFLLHGSRLWISKGIY
jgi:hypothetical protein